MYDGISVQHTHIHECIDINQTMRSSKHANVALVCCTTFTVAVLTLHIQVPECYARLVQEPGGQATQVPLSTDVRSGPDDHT